MVDDFYDLDVDDRQLLEDEEHRRWLEERDLEDYEFKANEYAQQTFEDIPW